MPRYELTNKQIAFCEEYVANGYNAIEAYRVAYPNSCDNSLRSNPYQLLQNPKVKVYIRNLQKERFDALNISADRIAVKLAEIAFADKKDEDYIVSAQLKALDLLQKQLGLQNQKIEMNGEQKIVLTIGDEDDA